MAVSHESSIGCTFSAAGLREPAPHFLFTTLPASAAGLCPYMAAADSQSAQSRQLIQTASVREMRRVGTANRNELHRTIQNNIAHTHTHTHTHIH